MAHPTTWVERAKDTYETDQFQWVTLAAPDGFPEQLLGTAIEFGLPHADPHATNKPRLIIYGDMHGCKGIFYAGQKFVRENPKTIFQSGDSVEHLDVGKILTTATAPFLVPRKLPLTRTYNIRLGATSTCEVRAHLHKDREQESLECTIIEENIRTQLARVERTQRAQVWYAFGHLQEEPNKYALLLKQH